MPEMPHPIHWSIEDHAKVSVLRTIALQGAAGMTINGLRKKYRSYLYLSLAQLHATIDGLWWDDLVRTSRKVGGKKGRFVATLKGIKAAEETNAMISWTALKAACRDGPAPYSAVLASTPFMRPKERTRFLRDKERAGLLKVKREGGKIIEVSRPGARLHVVGGESAHG